MSDLAINVLALLVFGGFVAVLLVDRRRKRRQATAAIERVDPDRPAELEPEPEPEPDTWPPTR